jgi:hypothetical protein
MLRFVWLTLLCWMLLAPVRLHADASDYDQALEAALAAHARGDFTSARASMERAHALSPSARTLRGLAIIAHAQGRHDEAVVWCDAALSSGVQALTPTLRESVEELSARSLQLVAQLRLSLTPVDATVQIDGEQPRRRPDSTVLLPPGAHRLRASAPGFVPYEAALEAQAGAVEVVEVTLAAAPDAAPRRAELMADPQIASMEMAAKARPSFEPPSSGDRWWTRRRRTLTFALGGVGALGGGALLLVAARKFAAVDEACREQPAGACTHTEAERRLDDAHVRPYVRASAGLLAVGGATLVTALVLELWSRRSTERVAVALTPNGALLRARF